MQAPREAVKLNRDRSIQAGIDWWTPEKSIGNLTGSARAADVGRGRSCLAARKTLAGRWCRAFNKASTFEP